MKAIKLIIALVFLGNIAFSQNKAVDKIFDKYGNNDAFTVVNVGPDLMTAVGGNEDGQDLDGFIDAVSGVRILTLEGATDKLSNQFSNDLKTLFKEDKYKRILHVKDGSEVVAIYAIKGKKGFNELGLVVTEPGESVLVYVTGNNINLSSLGQLGNIEGLAGVAGQF